MKTYKDVIEETIEYYKTHPFGYNGSSCVYFGDNGEMCAVGRCLNEPELLRAMEINADDVLKRGYGNGLKDEYKHLNNLEFWNTLQKYHDFLATGQNAFADEQLEHLYKSYSS